MQRIEHDIQVLENAHANLLSNEVTGNSVKSIIEHLKREWQRFSELQARLNREYVQIIGPYRME